MHPPVMIVFFSTSLRTTSSSIEDAKELNFLARMARSEEHTSELQSLMRISYAVFCLKKKNNKQHRKLHSHNTAIQQEYGQYRHHRIIYNIKRQHNRYSERHTIFRG